MSVWTSHDDLHFPPLAAGWLETCSRYLADLALRARMALALTGGLLAALVVLVIVLPGSPSQTPAVPGDVSASAWTRQATAPRLALRASALVATPQSANLWSRQRGEVTEAEDRITFGDIDAPGIFASITASRGASAVPETGLFIATARLAANAGLAVSHFVRAEAYTGRFGATETAFVTVSRVFPSGSSRELCLAWRAAGAGTDVSLAGFICPTQGQTIDSKQSECLLRDLTALPAADPALRQVLAASLPLPGCGPAPTGNLRSARRS